MWFSCGSGPIMLNPLETIFTGEQPFEIRETNIGGLWKALIVEKYIHRITTDSISRMKFPQTSKNKGLYLPHTAKD